MFTSLSIYSCPRLLHRLHHSAVAGPTCGEASILPFTSTRLRLELCFLSTSAGEDFPQRTSHPSPLHVYPNSSAALPPTSRPSAAVFLAPRRLPSSQLHLCSAAFFTRLQRCRILSILQKPGSETSQTCFFKKIPPKQTISATFVAEIPSLKIQRSF